METDKSPLQRRVQLSCLPFREYIPHRRCDVVRHDAQACAISPRCGGGYKCSGSDPIKVISFLAKCKKNFDNEEMPEAMALMALPHLLNPPAKEVYESQGGYFRSNQGLIASWSAAVSWLLRMYVTSICSDYSDRASARLRKFSLPEGALCST